MIINIQERTCTLLSFYTRVATTWTCTCTITTTLIGRRHRLGVVNYPQGLFIFSQKNLIAMRMHCSMQPNIESLWIILGQEGQIIIPAFIDMLSTFIKRYLHMIKYKIFYIYRYIYHIQWMNNNYVLISCNFQFTFHVYFGILDIDFLRFSNIGL